LTLAQRIEERDEAAVNRAENMILDERRQRTRERLTGWIQNLRMVRN